MNKEIIIALCAGEASGDLLGAHLIDALKQQYDNIRFVGIGGPRMKAAGLISLEEQEPLAVRGYVEVLGSLSEILKIRRGLIDQLKKISPHVFVGIDAPNFNLPVAAKLKAAGIPTLHYVSPSVWAWKPERVHKIVRQVNKVLCLFPMEPQLYRQAGGQAEYVGHPLAQILPMENSREAVRQRLKLGLTTPVFALLPGSRVSEVDYMAPIFLRTAALILKDLPEAVFLMPYPSAAVRERLQHYLKQSEFQTLPIRLQAAKAELAYMASDVVLVTSGTASLEVALCKRPMVISYKISSLTYSLVKRKITIPYVGLPNILLNKMMVPELLQNDATPEKLSAAVLDWYYHPARVGELEEQFMQLHRRLQRNTDELAAYAVLTEAGLSLPKPVAEGEDESLFLPQNDDAANEAATPPEPEAPASEPAPESPSPNATLAAPESETAFRQPEPENAALTIPPPSIVMGNNTAPAPAESEPEPSPVAAETPSPSENPAPEPSPLREFDTNQYELNMNNKVKRKSGLFGWLSSLFNSKQPPQIQEVPHDAQAPVPPHDATSIAVVSRANETDIAPATTQSPETTPPATEPAKPERVVLEQETVAAAQPVNLPKSSVLTVNKPNIFDKYKQNGEETPASTTNNEPQVNPSIQVQPVQQPTLKVKVTAVVRKTDEQQPQPETAAVAPAAEPTPAPAPVVAAAPTPAPEAATQAVPQTPPVGALAQYINQASMAWLPESMKNPAPTPVQAAVAPEPAPAPAPEPEPAPVVSAPAPKLKPSITIQVAPKTSAQSAPLHDVKVPTAEVKTETETAAAPAVEKTETTAQQTAPSTTAEVQKTEPENPAIGHNSFASVFRKHTLHNDQAQQQDNSHNQAETETDAPAQIVLNRSEAMSSAPTQAEAPTTDDGVPAPRVSKYSSNPNRYNSGIFF